MVMVDILIKKNFVNDIEFIGEIYFLFFMFVIENVFYIFFCMIE